MKQLIIVAAALILCVACNKKPAQTTGTGDTTYITTVKTDTTMTKDSLVEKADSSNKK